MSTKTLPPGLPPLPPVPDGFDRWEYRGMEWESGPCEYRFCQDGDSMWQVTYHNRGPRGGSTCHYLEAVRETPPAAAADADADADAQRVKYRTAYLEMFRECAAIK